MKNLFILSVSIFLMANFAFAKKLTHCESLEGEYSYYQSSETVLAGKVARWNQKNCYFNDVPDRLDIRKIRPTSYNGKALESFYWSDRLNAPIKTKFYLADAYNDGKKLLLVFIIKNQPMPNNLNT